MKNQREKQRNHQGVGIFLLGALIVAGVGWISPARADDSPLANARVRFMASSSSGVKIVGMSKELKLESRGAWLIFKVPVNTVTTHRDTRDRQLRDRYLEADTHPAIELRIARNALDLPKADGVTAGDVDAKLILHGKARDTRIHYSFERHGSWLTVNTRFRIDLRAHGIDLPSYRGITVMPEVEVEVGFATLNRLPDPLVADAM